MSAYVRLLSRHFFLFFSIAPFVWKKKIKKRIGKKGNEGEQRGEEEQGQKKAFFYKKKIFFWGESFPSLPSLTFQTKIFFFVCLKLLIMISLYRRKGTDVEKRGGSEGRGGRVKRRRKKNSKHLTNTDWFKWVRIVGSYNQINAFK